MQTYIHYLQTKLLFITDLVGGRSWTEATNCTCVSMESRNAESEAIHATVQRGSEQMRHDGAGRIDVYQGAARSDIILPEILSRGHLWMLRDEYKRREYLGLHNVTRRSIIKFLTSVNQAIGILNSLNLILEKLDVSLVA